MVIDKLVTINSYTKFTSQVSAELPNKFPHSIKIMQYSTTFKLQS